MFTKVQSRVLNADRAFQVIPLPPHLLPTPLLHPYHHLFQRQTRLTFIRPKLIILLSHLKPSSDITLHPEKKKNQSHTMATVLTTAYLTDPNLSLLHLVHYSCHAGLLSVLEEYRAQSFLGSSSYCSFCMGHVSEPLTSCFPT